MKIFAETDRIILREIVETDAPAFFEMDADPEVHTFLGSTPLESIDQAITAIQHIRAQYVALGIGRWAIVDKETNEFVGWGGLKFRQDTVNGHTDFYDVGYRLRKKFWGMGYATESAIASIRYAFETLTLDAVFALANVDNISSRKALLKSGLKITTELTHEGIACHWFEISRADYELTMHRSQSKQH